MRRKRLSKAEFQLTFLLPMITLLDENRANRSPARTRHWRPYNSIDTGRLLEELQDYTWCPDGSRFRDCDMV